MLSVQIPIFEITKNEMFHYPGLIKWIHYKMS